LDAVQSLGGSLQTAVLLYNRTELLQPVVNLLALLL
jgi:hypothetical protein